MGGLRYDVVVTDGVLGRPVASVCLRDTLTSAAAAPGHTDERGRGLRLGACTGVDVL